METYQKFEIFHRDNPDVYNNLVTLARQWKHATGRHALGIAALYERVRWEIQLATNDPDYKLCNAYRAYYARLIMSREPDLAGLFSLRTSAADEWIERAA